MTTNKLAAAGGQDKVLLALEAAYKFIRGRHSQIYYGPMELGPMELCEQITEAMGIYRRAGEGSQAAPPDALEKIKALRAWAAAKADTHEECGSRTLAAMFMVKRDTLDSVIDILKASAAAAGSGTFAAHLDMRTVAWCVDHLRDGGMLDISEQLEIDARKFGAPDKSGEK